jgi:hypothetical protein
VSTALFDVKPYIKIFILHKPLSLPFPIAVPAIEVFHPASFETEPAGGDTYIGLVHGGYIVREVDTRGNDADGKIVKERPGTNRVMGWSYYVDKAGRAKIF